MRSYAFASAAGECVGELWVGASGAAANRWGCAAGWRGWMVSGWGHAPQSYTHCNTRRSRLRRLNAARNAARARCSGVGSAWRGLWPPYRSMGIDSNRPSAKLWYDKCLQLICLRKLCPCPS